MTNQRGSLQTLVNPQRWLTLNGQPDDVRRKPMALEGDWPHAHSSVGRAILPRNRPTIGLSENGSVVRVRGGAGSPDVCTPEDPLLTRAHAERCLATCASFG